MSQNDTLLFIRSLGCTVRQFAAHGLSVGWINAPQDNGQPARLIPLIYMREDDQEIIITTPQAKALIKRGTLPPRPTPPAPRPNLPPEPPPPGSSYYGPPSTPPPGPLPEPPASPPEPPPHYRPAAEDYAF